MKQSHLISAMCQSLGCWLDSGRKATIRKALQKISPAFFDTQVEKPHTIFGDRGENFMHHVPFAYERSLLLKRVIQLLLKLPYAIMLLFSITMSSCTLRNNKINS